MTATNMCSNFVVSGALTTSPNNSIIPGEAVYFSCDPWVWRLLEKLVSFSDWRAKQS